jgi:hypothetical protein
MYSQLHHLRNNDVNWVIVLTGKGGNEISARKWWRQGRKWVIYGDRTKCLSIGFQLAFPCTEIKMITRLEHTWTLRNACTSSYSAASCRYMSWKCIVCVCVCVRACCFKVVVLVLDISNNLKTTALDSRLHAAELMTCWEQMVWSYIFLCHFHTYTTRARNLTYGTENRFFSELTLQDDFLWTYFSCFTRKGRRFWFHTDGQFQIAECVWQWVNAAGPNMCTILCRNYALNEIIFEIYVSDKCYPPNGLMWQYRCRPLFETFLFRISTGPSAIPTDVLVVFFSSSKKIPC